MKHRILVLVPLMAALLLLTVSSVAADPGPTCTIVTDPVSPNEGQPFVATVSCDEVDDVYGFLLGTTYAGDVTTTDNNYANGSFQDDTGEFFLSTTNTRNYYDFSRRGLAEGVDSPFTLGSLDFTAKTGLTANGSATLSFTRLLLGDKSGAQIVVSGVNSTIAIDDLLTLNLTVTTDGSVSRVRNVIPVIDGVAQPAKSVWASSVVFNLADKFEDDEDPGTATTPFTLAVDMSGHLHCYATTLGLNEVPSITNMTIKLYAGDVVNTDVIHIIDIEDATAIGGAYGTAGAAEEDVNGDGTVNILDLIHVGRNWWYEEDMCTPVV